jgi:hypothetical protein
LASNLFGRQTPHRRHLHMYGHPISCRGKPLIKTLSARPKTGDAFCLLLSVSVSVTIFLPGLRKTGDVFLTLTLTLTLNP